MVIGGTFVLFKRYVAMMNPERIKSWQAPLAKSL
jgi:hypothetical protein